MDAGLCICRCLYWHTQVHTYRNRYLDYTCHMSFVLWHVDPFSLSARFRVMAGTTSARTGGTTNYVAQLVRPKHILNGLVDLLAARVSDVLR